MALNGILLGTEIKTQVIDVFKASLGTREATDADILQLWQDIGNKIVTHIITYGQVQVGIPVQVTPATGTGATTGPGVIT